MGELDPWMNDDWLRQLFWSLGEEVTTRISIDKYGGTYAFIDFKTHEGATKILQTYNGTIIPNTNKYFKLNWSNRDGNGMPILNPSMHHNQNDGCSVFVGDLGPDVDDSILLAAFQSRYATTVSAKVMIDPTTGFSRGFGFVKFYDPADQQRSIDEMQGVYVGSRAVRVSIARPRSAFQNNNPNNMSLNPNVPEHEITTVFVGGLNNTITEEELRGYFGTYGDILAVKLIPNKNIAFIQYDKRSSAEQSIAELNGSHLGGAKLRLSFGRTQLNLGPTYHHNTPTYNRKPPPKLPCKMNSKVFSTLSQQNETSSSIIQLTYAYTIINLQQIALVVSPLKLIDILIPSVLLSGSSRKSPLDPDALVNTPHRIDGKRVHIEFIRNQAQEGRSSNEQTARLLARTFCMGSMIGVNTFVEEWKTNNDVKLWINYTLRNCTIFFKQLNEEYKVVYKFKDLSTDMVVEREGNVTAFTISLRHPGQFWRRNNNVITETSFSSKRGQKWERVTLIPLTPDSDITSRPSSPFLPLPRKGVLNIGSWIVYRIVFNPGSNHKANFEQQLQEAAFFNLVPQNLENCKPKIKIVEASTLPKPFDHADRSNKWNFDFDVLYMLESCISYYYFNEYNLTKEFYDMIANVDPSFAIGVLQIISQAKKPVYDPYEKFYDIWKRMGNRVKEEKTIPSHCTMLRKVIITPSHIYYQPPTLETTNRVIRHYKDQCDSFIRIQFVDEGFNRVGASGANGDTVSKNAIYNRIYDVLKRGVQIGKRRFEFLAFSSSQLREQGCWFFAPTRELTPNDIRNWMGVFSHEKVVAKHAVRMGQCFSSTRPIYTLTTDQIEYIDDIVRGQYTFSDGVGKISPSLAQQVALKMELKTVPSAFQFRLGGAKGVLTVSKELENKKVQIQLRPSQIKFESEHTTLEVIRPSTYIHSYLNRQAITLLACLGVPDDVFMTLMHEMIQDVNRLFQKSEEAIRVLLGNVDQAGTAVSLVSILQAGFLEHRDPFIRNMLNLFRIMVLKDLKKKAKIIVPQGAYLLGVMDETGTLEEGEVFVQICDTTSNGTNKRIITGDAVVYRNPCFHPGDIRTVKAVDKKELHHLFDVIVFPQKGFRDIPSMCSGGDLDGDDYTVYWDPRLLPSTKNYPPMDYTPEPPKKVDKVQIKDIIKFFVNYMDNDVLGQIANAHLATADLSPLGARDGRCIKLAHLHSTAVGKLSFSTIVCFFITFPSPVVWDHVHNNHLFR
ncbi:RNA dependent RNA polymerase-domain-containing protein [Mycotypha africana]|uniref:RNA dependent RNA polymerase-domain-containing protein n=1 Tax=Mycotypha africana TaxID=64632 RepID=UPI002300337E|nr:RNA dependent RNA polymerase-domain-containing protein [Mycotypha africana]KAI8977017.1 RNA dependent RNA polymerase-domain-containing protein [Mycotypha africana]